MGARPQARFSSLAAQDKVKRRASVAQFNKQISKKEYFAARKRYGCIDFGDAAGSSSSSPRKFTAFYDHQILAAHNLICKNFPEKYSERAGTGLLFNHLMGCGKTHAGIAAAAVVKLCAVPIDDDGKALIICPPTVFAHWKACIEEIVDFSNNYTDREKLCRGKGVLCASRHQDLTAESINNADLILTTQSAISHAYLSYRILLRIPYITKGGHERKRKEWANRVDKKGHEIPMHPFFKFVFRHKANGLKPFAVVVADEMPLYCNPTTCVGRAVQFCCTNSTYVVALSGKPARSRPKQMAHLCKTACWKPPSFGEVKQWHVQGQKDTAVSRKTVNAFMAEMVDLCDETTVDLPEMNWSFFQFRPFMFLQTDGTVKDSQKKRHDGWMRWVKVKRQQAQMDPDFASHYESQMWRGLARMTGYAFDATLGDHMALGFKENPIECYRMALEQPSNTVRVIYRSALKAFQHGINKILVYSNSATQLQIFKNYCLDKGGCGKLLRYMGCTPQKKRDVTLQRFLRDPNERGMLFMSSAGSVGTNVSPGCHTVFVIGDLPYNNSCLEQAVSRVRRIDQPEGTKIQVVVFEPRYSISSAKLVQHIDKRERLERALNRGDFSHFDPQRNEKWRLTTSIVDYLDDSDQNGNYPESAHARKVRLDYQAKVVAATAAGEAPPQKPREAEDVPDLKADDLSDDQLPTILHGTRDPKTEGPLAPEPDPSDSEEDEPIFEGRTLSAENPAGRIARKKTTKKKARKTKKALASEAQLNADLENAEELSDDEFIDNDFDGSSDEEEQDEPMEEEEDSGDESE